MGHLRIYHECNTFVDNIGNSLSKATVWHYEARRALIKVHVAPILCQRLLVCPSYYAAAHLVSFSDMKF